jgi:hypothetical protein
MTLPSLLVPVDSYLLKLMVREETSALCAGYLGEIYYGKVDYILEESEGLDLTAWRAKTA